MWCIIPAAGKGTRMAPVVGGLPKTLIEVGGESLLARLISGVEEAVDGICIVIPPSGEGRQALRRAIESLDTEVPIQTRTQIDRKGVADAVWQCRSVVDGPFLVAMADVVYDPPLAPYVTALESAGLPAVLVEPTTGPTREPAGVVTVADARVTAIEKRPVAVSDEFRVAGAFAFPREAFQVFGTARPGSGEFELEDVVNVLMKQGPVHAVVYDGWRRNVNTPRDLKEVRTRISANRRSR